LDLLFEKKSKVGFTLQKEAGLSFTTFSHQAVDFILGKLHNFLSHHTIFYFRRSIKAGITFFYRCIDQSAIPFPFSFTEKHSVIRKGK
jgi:hypothetical protein